MTNAELWGQVKEFTAEASANSRRLGFAAVAIFWTFNQATQETSWILLLGLLLAGLFFVFDVLQYVLAAVRTRSWTRQAEQSRYDETGSIEGDYKKPASLDTLPYALWWVKLGVLLLSYICLAGAVISSIRS